MEPPKDKPKIIICDVYESKERYAIDKNQLPSTSTNLFRYWIQIYSVLILISDTYDLHINCHTIHVTVAIINDVYAC